MGKYKVKLEKRQTFEIEVSADDVITAIVLAEHKAKNRDSNVPVECTVIKVETYDN